MSTDDTEKKISSGPVKWITATLVGVGTGAAKFMTDARKEFSLNVKKFPDIEKYRIKTHDVEIGKLRGLREQEKIGTQEFINRYHQQKDAYFAEMDKVTEKLGIKSKGLLQNPLGYIEGSIQRFQTLSAHTRTPVVFGAVATSVIGFAGTVMFFNSIASRHHLKHLEKNLANKEQDPSRD